MLCKIGDVEVWRILEMNGPFLPPEALFPTAGPDVAKQIETLVPGSVSADGRLVIPIQGFLLKTRSHIILVDACVGNHKTLPKLPEWHQREDSRFMTALHAAGAAPSQVDFVLCTHLHSDHVGWNTVKENGQWVPTFPNARYLMPSADKDHYAANPNDTYTESVLPVLAAGQAELVSAGHKLGDEVTLIPTPGHTPGHVSVLVQSAGVEAVITGDALHSAAQCTHPE